MYLRMIQITNGGGEMKDISMPTVNENLKFVVDEFKRKHNATEVAGDDTFVHYLSKDGQSFLGVYFVQRF